DGFQAGLSWRVILHKRARCLEAFDGFDPERMARYDRRKIAQLLKDPGIVRNRQKVSAAIGNARAFLAFQEQGGSFGAFLWGFVGGTPKQYRRRTLRDLPARSRESDAMSAALAERGFRFVGPTICYAFMQAAGVEKLPPPPGSPFTRSTSEAGPPVGAISASSWCSAITVSIPCVRASR